MNGANVVRVGRRKCNVKGGCGDMATCCEIRVDSIGVLVYWTCECRTWTDNFELSYEVVTVDSRDV
jgi:hypothetical protein